MVDSAKLRDAVGILRGALERAKAGASNYPKIASAQPEVLARYQDLFSAERIPSLTEDEFRDFLLFKNNKHWWFPLFNLSKTIADMDLLRQALLILIDEDRPIEVRLDVLIPPPGKPMVPYLNRAILTAVLLIVHPMKYGVWNSISENALGVLGLLPKFPPSTSFSQRYLAFNEVLTGLAQELRLDLWSLDALWWDLPNDEAVDELPADCEVPLPVSSVAGNQVQFYLETYLHQFMRDNWESIELGQEWELHQEDGEVVGYEYKAGDIGYVDLLARHRSAPRWLVVELKRGQSSDATVGQVLRYMGWVKQNLASTGETVTGLIVAHSADAKILCALEYTIGVDLRLYEVDFRLISPGSA